METPISAHSSTGEAKPRNSVIWAIAYAATLLGLIALRRRGSLFAGAAQALRCPPEQGSSPHAPTSRQQAADSRMGGSRRAAAPSEIAASGWKDIALRVFHDISEKRLILVAAGVTFYVLLAIFPAIAALVTCYGLIADVATINGHLNSLRGVLPSGAIDIMGEQVKRIAAKGDTTLGITFFTSLLISIWSANAGMKAIIDALNIVFDEEEKRGFLWLNLCSLACTAGALLFIILALVGIVVLPFAFNTVGLSANAWYISLLRWPALLLVMLFGLALLYRYGPSREPPRWRWVTWGSAIAAVLWLVTSLAFSWYVSNFGTYNETYGSLGAVIGFMTWIWISTIIVLVGGEINAEIERQTKEKDEPRAGDPLQMRGTTIIDPMGAAA